MRSLVLASADLITSALGYFCAPTVLDAAVGIESELLANQAAQQRADLYANDRIPTLWPVTSHVVPRASLSASR